MEEMNVIVRGVSWKKNDFETALKFILIPPTEGSQYYGTGCYMLVENASTGIEVDYVDVRYTRTHDIRVLAERWVKWYYGKNLREIIMEA